MQNLSEPDIIQGCIAGKQLHQQALYHRFASKMFAVCLRYATDYHTAEDLLQEGFIKVFTHIQRFRNEGSFEGWVRRIFINTAIEHYRRSVHLYPILDNLANTHTPEVSEEAFHKLAADELITMVQTLSPGYRTVFNLYALEGYSHKEISEMLGITEGTSKSQLARARYLLQKKLEEANQYNREVYV